MNWSNAAPYAFQAIRLCFAGSWASAMLSPLYAIFSEPEAAEKKLVNEFDNAVNPLKSPLPTSLNKTSK
jgi:hypothetical protein